MKEAEIELFFKWIWETKGITVIDLLEAIEYYDEFEEYMNKLVKR